MCDLPEKARKPLFVVSLADHRATRLTRRAIQHAFRCPRSDPEAPAADKQQVARSPVDKAVRGDVPAIRSRPLRCS